MRMVPRKECLQRSAPVANSEQCVLQQEGGAHAVEAALEAFNGVRIAPRGQERLIEKSSSGDEPFRHPRCCSRVIGRVGLET